MAISGVLSIALAFIAFQGIAQAVALLVIIVGIGWLVRGIIELIAGIQAKGVPGRGFVITGGVIVAPFAARLAGRLPQHVMGTLVGGLILIVNGQVLLLAVSLPSLAGWGMLAAAIVATGMIAQGAYGYDKAERSARTSGGEGETALAPQS